LIGRNVKVSGDFSYRVASLEAIDQVLDAGAAVGDQGEAEGHLWINHDFGVLIGRKSD
jgi:hypothetical protein